MRRLVTTSAVFLLVALPTAAQAAVLWRPPPEQRCTGDDGRARVKAESKWSGSGWQGPYKFVQRRVKGTISQTRAATSKAAPSWSEEGWVWQEGTVITKVKKGDDVIRRWETKLRPC